MSSDLGSKPDSEPQQIMPKSDLAKKDTETKENVNSESVDNMPDSESCDKGKTLPEPIRVGKDMPRLPPIDMAELTSILQGPNMPSQKLMKEVTEKIKLKNDESGSDDGSVSGSGGVGIRGILDCILEVSLFHQDSDDESDTDGDDIFVRELPCRFCKKIFGSTMTLNTHVLMTHSQEDPSVLNVRNQSSRKDKLSCLGRSRSMEGKEKDGTMSGRKRSSVGLQEEAKKSRSRHSSKEQTIKVGDNKKEEAKPLEKSCLPEASAVDSLKTTTTPSSQRTRQSSHEQDADAKKCDPKSSTLPEQSTSAEQEKDTPTPSKASKRKSSSLSKVSSSACDLPTPVNKKAKRSRNQSGDSKSTQESPVPRRSSRRK